MSVAVSVFDIFKVGIGPSSSHTVGPMRAARIFVTDLAQSPVWPEVTRVRAELFGSLGATGHGHGSEAAVLLGLEGEDPATVDTDQTPARAASIAMMAVSLWMLSMAVGRFPLTSRPTLSFTATGRSLFIPTA